MKSKNWFCHFPNLQCNLDIIDGIFDGTFVFSLNSSAAQISNCLSLRSVWMIKRCGYLYDLNSFEIATTMWKWCFKNCEIDRCAFIRFCGCNSWSFKYSVYNWSDDSGVIKSRNSWFFVKQSNLFTILCVFSLSRIKATLCLLFLIDFVNAISNSDSKFDSFKS